MNMTPTTDKHFSPDNPSQHHDDQNDEFEDKIVQEFGHLLEKSKQLFNGLR